MSTWYHESKMHRIFSGGSGPKNQKDGSFSEWSGNESGTPDG